MTHTTLAAILWGALALSLGLTAYGVGCRSSTALYVAALLSFLFGIAAIFSIGMFIVLLAAAQLGLAIAYRRR